MKQQFLLKKSTLLISVAVALFSATSHAQCPVMTPVWEDNFEGTALDTTKWHIMEGDGCDYGICGWGNNELQHYSANNISVADGILTITARKQRVRSKNYTSARIRTANVPNGGEWRHGRFEARIKLPKGAGMWPAFWMLPTDPDVGWPMSGEIDIMEATGQADMVAFGTLHYGNAWPNNEWTSNRILKQPDRWSDDFYTFALEWEPNEMRWYVDDLLYSVKTPDDLGNPAFWTFENYHYHFILNLAVGGSLGGPVDDSMLPQTMQVDYVRVYSTAMPSLAGEHLVEPGSVTTLSVIDEAGSDSSYQWTLPQGASIVSGAGSNAIQILWGETGGEVSVALSNNCGSHTLKQAVYVLPALSTETMLDDFESNRNLNYVLVNGILHQEAGNPAPNTVNNSAVVAEYSRDPASQWDVIIADTQDVADVDPFIRGDKAFYLDLYTHAPIGTEILVQLENSSKATASNYPTGRHSKFVAHVETTGQWHSLKFLLEDRLDGMTKDTDVNSLVLLFAPNSFTDDLYYWDNFRVAGMDGSDPGNGNDNGNDDGNGDEGNAATVHVTSITTYTINAGRGTKYGAADVVVSNNLGQAVANVAVTGNFGGSYNEQGVTAVTNAQGVASFQTSTTLNGGVTVTFCVSELEHGQLDFDAAGSTGICP